MQKIQKPLVDKLIALRRKILTIITPEFVWPKSVIIDNANIKIRGEPYTFGIKLSLKRGLYEGPERNLIRSFDLNGEKIIEIGGSIGILTAVLAEKVGSNGKVISIEASNQISSYSRSWLEKNPNVKVLTGICFPVGKLSQNINVIEFIESGNILEGKVVYNYNSRERGDRYDIYDIQKLMLKYNLQPTILVFDVEGCEKIILEQKPDIPITVKLILVELHPQFYGEQIATQIMSRIVEEGFCEVNSEGNVHLFKRTS